jgi:hypothetical protein
LIEEQRAICADLLANFQANLSKLTDEQHFEKILFTYRISQTPAMLACLDDSRAEIQTVMIKAANTKAVHETN